MALSLIVCSVDDRAYSKLLVNIAETIGDIKYEIIKFENNFHKLPLTKAYNRAAEKSQFDYLLFIHEDIYFHTKNWGSLLIEELKNEQIGVIGIAGSDYVPYAPCSFTNPVSKYNYANILQYNKGEVKKYSVLPSANAVIKGIDGVFIGVRRAIFNEVKFNEELSGFHGYDQDFSLRVSLKYKNRITEKILIEHFSPGKKDRQHLLNNIYIRKNISIGNEKNDTFNEYSAFRSFINEMIQYKFSKSEIFRYGKYFMNCKRFGGWNYFKSILFLGYSLIKSSDSY